MSRVDRKYIEELKKLQDGRDVEREHELADKVLCDLLTELSYSEIVEEYEKIVKYFS